MEEKVTGFSNFFCFKVYERNAVMLVKQMNTYSLIMHLLNGKELFFQFLMGIFMYNLQKKVRIV